MYPLPRPQKTSIFRKCCSSCRNNQYFGFSNQGNSCTFDTRDRILGNGISTNRGNGRMAERLHGDMIAGSIPHFGKRHIDESRGSIPKVISFLKVITISSNPITFPTFRSRDSFFDRLLSSRCNSPPLGTLGIRNHPYTRRPVPREISRPSGKFWHQRWWS